MSEIEQLKSRIEELEKLVSSLERKCSWKDCEEEPPKEYKEYLVEYTNPHEGDCTIITTCLYAKIGDKTYWCVPLDVPQENVFRWCELPH